MNRTSIDQNALALAGVFVLLLCACVGTRRSAEAAGASPQQVPAASADLTIPPPAQEPALAGPAPVVPPERAAAAAPEDASETASITEAAAVAAPREVRCAVFLDGVSKDDIVGLFAGSGVVVEDLAPPSGAVAPEVVLLVGVEQSDVQGGERRNVDPALLAGKRVVAVGKHAMQWLDRLRITLTSGGCANGFSGELVPEGRFLVPYLGAGANALSRPIRDIDDSNDSFFGLYMGRPGLVERVSVLARFAGDPRYAAIAQEGDVTFIGVNAPISEWSPELRKLVVDFVAGKR